MINFVKKGIRCLYDPYYRFLLLQRMGRYDNLNDEEFIRKKWKAFYGKEIDLENPKTLCEKLQWLKLYYRKPEFTMMVDKYEVKNFIAEMFGNDYVIPTLGVWDNPDDIDFETLPDSFVLKTTHTSGGMITCRNKSDFNTDEAKEKLRKLLNRDYYLLVGREWPYKNVKRRIIAEPLIEQLGKPESIEYKTTCFNGKAAFVTICSGIAHAEFEKRKNDHFDKNFNKLNWYVNYKPAPVTPPQPPQWNEIINFAEKAAQNIPYIRVDTYIINGKILFGEFTFFTWCGFMHFEPEEWDYKLGQMLVLPEKKIITE